MKANKITLKKMRIEYLERIAGTLEYEIKSNRDNLENAKENLEEAKTDTDDFQYYQDRVDEFEAWVQVGESLMAELEKNGVGRKLYTSFKLQKTLRRNGYV